MMSEKILHDKKLLEKQLFWIEISNEWVHKKTNIDISDISWFNI